MFTVAFVRDERIKPFVYKDFAEEALFCFKISPDQAGRIDPEAERFLGELLFGAQRVPDIERVPDTERVPDIERVPDTGRVPDTERRVSDTERVPDTAPELPAGAYLFAQEREALSQEDWLFMAMEVQKEGLWERLKLGDNVYLRCLFEDNSAVTQVFRPYWIDTVSTI